MNTYVSNRVLKINVGFLLAAGVGNHHDSAFDVPTVRIAEDLTVDYVRGPIRLSRTAAGILVQGQLEAGISGECIRCLDAVTENVTITVEELYAYPASLTSEFSVYDDAVLDLAPLLRAEVMLATTNGLLCREDCKGLCPECGINLNDATCTCSMDAINPQFAGLKDFLK